MGILPCDLVDRYGHLSIRPLRFPFPGPSSACVPHKRRVLGKEMALHYNDGETSDAASIEGGIPYVRNITCCICLENFTERGMSTVTNCQHQYHLQCLLEWCQRSPNCPTCRREVSLLEPKSQDLLEAVTHERKMKAEELKNARVQITLADLNSASTEAQVQELLVQYMASMGRRYQFSTQVHQSNASRNSGGESSVAFSYSIRSIVRNTKSWLGRGKSMA